MKLKRERISLYRESFDGPAESSGSIPQRLPDFHRRCEAGKKAMPSRTSLLMGGRHM
jgi:hypothetical protein